VLAAGEPLKHVVPSMDERTANAVADLILGVREQDAESSAVNQRDRKSMRRRRAVKRRTIVQVGCRRGDLNPHALVGH
jgi:hypothetical protein